MATSIIKEQPRHWKRIYSNIILIPLAAAQTFDVSGYTEILINCGKKNIDQAYGGMTIVLPVNPAKSMPKYVPCYDVNNVALGTILCYIHDDTVLELRSFFSTDDALVEIYAR